MSNSGSGTPQLTLRAVVLAVVLAMILSAANAYLGLFAGLTIATAIPAAVVSMGVLRLLGGGTILENNIVQTGASAGSSIAAGVIFTIPALVIMGYWPEFKYWWVLGIAGLGGLLAAGGQRQGGGGEDHGAADGEHRNSLASQRRLTLMIRRSPAHCSPWTRASSKTTVTTMTSVWKR